MDHLECVEIDSADVNDRVVGEGNQSRDRNDIKDRVRVREGEGEEGKGVGVRMGVRVGKLGWT